MKTITTVALLQETLEACREEGQQIGFAPTMGALHTGHLSLIDKSKTKADITVCSIFVNPTQFNNATDLEKYPRTLERDAKMLAAKGCDILFAPSSAEVYPDGTGSTVDVDFGQLDDVMEGAFRPGHFVGMAQVVKRLLDIVDPDYLVMGQKDYQQFTIVQHMLTALDIPTRLIICPIIREESGLAMSSRNARLSPQQRDEASVIHRTLLAARRKKKTHPVGEIIDYVTQRLDRPGFKMEYFNLVDGRSLADIEAFADHDIVVGCIACWVGEVRLIDNLIYKGFRKF